MRDSTREYLSLELEYRVWMNRYKVYRGNGGNSMVSYNQKVVRKCKEL